MEPVEIEDDVPFEPHLGGRPLRSASKTAALDEAAANCDLNPNAAAMVIHGRYYATAKMDGIQGKEQVKSLAKQIRKRRRSILPLP